MVSIQEHEFETRVAYSALQKPDHFTININTDIAAKWQISVDDCLSESHATAKIEHPFVRISFEPKPSAHSLKQPASALLGTHEGRHCGRISIECRWDHQFWLTLYIPKLPQES